MALLGFFRRQPPVRDVEALSRFIEEQSAHLVQKGIYEYARARSGPFSRMLFTERDFIATVERSRWTAFPLGLAMVGEMVEGVLRPRAGDDRQSILEPLSEVVLSVFDGYPTPEALGEARWAELRADLALRLARVGLHPPKSTIDIPEPFAEIYFDLMPIHEEMRSPDLPTARSYLKIGLTNIRDELVKRLDAAAVAAELRARGP